MPVLMNKAKRFVCALIITVLLLQPVCPAVIVCGAANIIGVSFERFLSVGANNSVPGETFSGMQEDQVFLSWPMSQFTYGSFQLKYFIDTEKQVVFTIQKQGNVAEAVYEVRAWNGINAYVTQQPAGYEIYTNIGGFRPAQTFIDQYNIADPAYNAVNSPTPAFKFKPDTGFSFRYHNAQVHFKWNALDDSMYFTTDRMQPGRIFKFILDVAPISGAAQSFEQRVLTGISQATFRAIPLSNKGWANSPDGVTAAQALDIDDDLDMYARPLNMVGDPTLDEHPGFSENELRLRFDIPKEYDEAAHDFAVMDLAANPLSVSFNLRAANSADNLQVFLKDIGDAGFDWSVNPDVVPSKKTGVQMISGDRFEVRLGNMPTGVLFNPSSDITVSARDLIANTSAIPFGRVFTFLNYEIFPQDGRFYALIRPYEGYSGYYMLKSGTMATNLTPSVIQYSDGSKPLMLPLIINSLNQGQYYFQVYFSPEKAFVNNNTDKAVYSQVVEYRANPSRVSVGIPNNFQIKDYALHADENYPGGEYGWLDFTLQWDIGDKTAIDALLQGNVGAMDIIYRIFHSLTPDQSNSLTYDDVTVSIDNTSGVTLAVYSDTLSRVTSAGQVVLDTRTENNGGMIKTVYFAKVSFSAPAALNNAVLIGSPAIDFTYPNIYFLNITPILLNTTPLDITASLFDSMTLNDLSRLLVPPPQNVNTVADAPTDRDASVQVTYIVPGGKIKEFVDSQFPAYPEKNVTVNLYVCANIHPSQNLYNRWNERFLREIFVTYDYSRRQSSAVAYESTSMGGAFSFTGTNAMNPVDVGNPYTDAREALRNGEIVCIQDITFTAAELDAILQNGIVFMQNWTFAGLDKNQKYIVCADLVVTEGYTSDIRLVEHSTLSVLSAVTTPSDKEIADSGRQIPPAPVLGKEDITLNSASLYWDPVLESSPSLGNDFMEYEIIRLRNSQMTDGLLNTREVFEVFYDNLTGMEKAGWRTDAGMLEFYGASGFEPAQSDKYDYQDGLPILFTDYTLSPNEIYFYYVRTVRIVNGGRTVSVWSHISVTTTPIEAPKNLTAVRDNVLYDAKTEIIIAFDAPIVDVSSLGEKFNLQYQLKEDQGAWSAHSTMSPETLTAGASASLLDGFSRFQYKIRNLRHGSVYSIRVRMVDEEGNGSLYTNVIEIKTEPDQKDYDDKRQADDWMKYLSNLLSRLFRRPYWVTRDNDRDFIAIYRPGMTDEMLRETADGRVPLAQSTAAQTVYYLPASTVRAANALGKGFVIRHGEMELLLSSKMIDPDDNDMIFAIGRQIKAGNIEDYYIRVGVRWQHRRYGSDDMREHARVTISAVGSKVSPNEWDKDMLERVAQTLADDGANANLHSIILAQIIKGEINENMVRFTDRVERAAYALALRIAAKNFSHSVRYNFTAARLDAPFFLVAKDIHPACAVFGFQEWAGGWRPQEIVAVGSNKAITSRECGEFFFMGNIIKMPGRDDSPLAELIARFHLFDYFALGHLDAVLTRKSAAGIIARVAGAPANANTFVWLRENKIINLPSRDPDGYVTHAEAVYMLMSLYAKKANARLDKLEIRSNEMAASMAGLDDKYLEAIRAAYELGVITDKKLQPQEPMKVMEMLRSLQTILE